LAFISEASQGYRGTLSPGEEFRSFTMLTLLDSVENDCMVGNFGHAEVFSRDEVFNIFEGGAYPKSDTYAGRLWCKSGYL
jgi:hypothetical protein